MYICIHSFSKIFPFRLLQNTDQSSLCFIVVPCWLFVLNIAVCTCQSQTLNLSIPLYPSFLVTINSPSKSVSLFLFCKQVHLYHFFRFCIVISYDICLCLARLISDRMCKMPQKHLPQ